jgi:hypothetical protein
MKRGDVRVTVERLRAGQPRAYADSVYEAILRVEWVPYFLNQPEEWAPAQFEESVIKRYVRALVHEFSDKPEFLEPSLTMLKKEATGVWHAIVTQPYCD